MDKVMTVSLDSAYETEMLNGHSTPERRLLAAVLGRAIGDLHSRERHIVRDALQWFTGVKTDGFTFIQVLEVLEFKPSQLSTIQRHIEAAIYGKCLCQGEESGAEYCELVEGAGLPICAEERPALWKAYRRRFR